MSMILHTGPNDFSFGNLQRREEGRRAIPLVIMGQSSRPGIIGRLGWVRSNA